MRIGPGQMIISGTPVSELATALAPFVQRIVIDRTELSGQASTLGITHAEPPSPD